MAILVAALACGVFAAVHFGVVQDNGAMERYREVLGPALHDLNQIPAVDGIDSSRPARVVGCQISDLQVTGPDAGRSWFIRPQAGEPNSARVMRARGAIGGFVTWLATHGWRVAAELDVRDPISGDRVDHLWEASLVRQADRVEAHFMWDESEDQIWASLYAEGLPEVCRWSHEG